MPVSRAPRPSPKPARASRTSAALRLGFVTILGLAGCREAATLTEARVRDSAGIRIVEHGNGRVEPLEWTVTREPLFRLGDSERDTLQQFQSISDARRLRDGRYVLLDGIEATLRYFAPDGRHLATAGRRGEGPGEFLDPYRIIALDGDTIQVADNGAQRLLVFDESGAFVRSFRLELVGDQPIALLGRLDDRTYLGRVTVRQALPTSGEVITNGLLVRLTDSLTVIDTMVRHPVAEAIAVPQGPHTALARTTFHGYGHVVTSGGEVVYVWSKSPEVRSYSAEGQLRSIVRPAASPRAFTRELREAWMEQMLEWAAAPGAQQRFRERWADRPMPDSLPVYSDLYVDEQRHVWLGQYELLEQPTRMWTVLDSTGGLAASVRMPADLRVMQIGADFILGAMRTELDVRTLVVFGLDRHP